MKIFPAEALREIDSYTIVNEPIASVDLMERAAQRLTNWYVRRYKTDREVMVFAGPGNNGGDALAMARLLAERQYKVQCFLVSAGRNLSSDCQENLNRLIGQASVNVTTITDSIQLPNLQGNQVVIDGLFGSGLKRKVVGVFADLIRLINKASSTIISIDIPSGLFGEDNTGNDEDTIICADHTLTFQFPFLSFFFRENRKFTGEWHVLDIKLHPEAIASTRTNYSTSGIENMQNYFAERDKFSHKGNYGHALIIAGKYGMMGAAILAGRAALRTGIGLVTVHVPKIGYEIAQIAIPEAIVSIDPSENLFTNPPELSGYQAIAIGPGIGIGPDSLKGLTALIQNCSVPLVLDADALNMIAANRKLIEFFPQNSILTPHPAEFERFAGKSADAYTRHIKQREFSVKHKVIIVLKGANTGISFPDSSYIFNVSGNPGMASGGSGDVLTGIIVSLLARGFKPEDAAVAGVFLHGLAGDIAADKLDQEAMIAGDIIDNLGEAFKRIKAKPFLSKSRSNEIFQ